MQRVLFFFAFLFMLVYTVQGGDIRRVKKAMEKSDFEKAEVLIQKSLTNQVVNPGVKYFYSLLYTNTEFSRFNIDSAHIYIRQAIQDFEKADQDILEELFDEEIFLEELMVQLKNVTQLAFEKAMKESTVLGWQAFIDRYPEAQQRNISIETRDSLAFQAVEKQSVEDLRKFLTSYPNSKFESDAQNMLDRLLVAQFWKSKSVKDLEQFIIENRASEYKETALRHLLKLSTISGRIDNFFTFIQEYPESTATNQAVNFIYHIDRGNEFADINKYVDFHSSSDSLRKVKKDASTFEFAIFDETYEFVSRKGRVSTTQLTNVDEEIICSGFSQDVIAGSDSNGAVILSKSGTEIIRAELIQDLGLGFLFVNNGSTKDVYHKSGARILKDVEDVEILNRQFFKVKRDKWALYSLMGISLTESRFDDIFVEGDFWFFERAKRLALTSAKKIAESFPGGLYLEFKFEDYELIEDNLLIGFRGDNECLLKSDGDFLVAWGEHHIYPEGTNGYVHDQKGYAFYGPAQYTYYPYLEVNEGFILRKEAKNQWMLFSNIKDWFIPLKDSVKLLSQHCALLTGDSPKLIFQNQRMLSIDSMDVPQSLSASSSLTLIKGKVSSVIDASGVKRFSGNFEKIQLLNDSLFSVSFNKKYGVLNRRGEEVLPIEYDYLSLEGGIISYIKEQKIGAYDLADGLQFEPIFESRIEKMKHLYKAKKVDLYGLVDHEGEEVLPFEYDEILEWTDSLVWGKQEDRFNLINVNTRETEMEVTLLKHFGGTPNSVIKYYSDSGFGLLNKKGNLLQPIYSDISWIGNDSQGVIMADQFLPEAGFHVVTYFDKSGQKIYSQAYSKENFEKVICDD